MKKQYGYQLAMRVQDLLNQLEEPITKEDQVFAQQALEELTSERFSNLLATIVNTMLAVKPTDE